MSNLFCRWCKMEVADEDCLAVHHRHHNGDLSWGMVQCLVKEGQKPCLSWFDYLTEAATHYEEEHNGLWPARAAQRTKIVREMGVPTTAEWSVFGRLHGDTPPSQLGATAEELDQEARKLAEFAEFRQRRIRRHRAAQADKEKEFRGLRRQRRARQADDDDLNVRRFFGTATATKIEKVKKEKNSRHNASPPSASKKSLSEKDGI